MPILDASSIDDTLAGSYTLEVSSPGLERPLRRPEHFRGAVGSTVSVKFRAGDQPARRIRGVRGRGRRRRVRRPPRRRRDRAHRYDDIVQARTVFEWGPQPKPGSRAARSTCTAEARTKEVARS